MNEVDKMYQDFRSILESFGPRERQLQSELEDARAQLGRLRRDFNRNVLMGADDQAEAIRPQIAAAEAGVQRLEEKVAAFRSGFKQFRTELERSSDHAINQVASDLHVEGRAEIEDCNRKYFELEAKVLEHRKAIIEAVGEMGRLARRAEQVGFYLVKTAQYQNCGTRWSDIGRLSIRRNLLQWPGCYLVSSLEFNRIFGTFPSWNFATSVPPELALNPRKCGLDVTYVED